VEQLFAATRIDPWFLDQMRLLQEVAEEVAGAPALTAQLLSRAKRHGFSDRQVGALRGVGEDTVREIRHAYGLRPVYKTVDTCAAEFAARTPYHYSSYDLETEVAPRERQAVIILGSGPNRIGQGIEFDYSCVHATMALAERYETIMVNCNPETVSTDYDISDRLYFEPLTFEDVIEVYEAERAVGPVAGMIVQLGGQTPPPLAAQRDRLWCTVPRARGSSRRRPQSRGPGSARRRPGASSSGWRCGWRSSTRVSHDDRPGTARTQPASSG